jgi:hypothetical protein
MPSTEKGTNKQAGRAAGDEEAFLRMPVGSPECDNLNVN